MTESILEKSHMTGRLSGAFHVKNRYTTVLNIPLYCEFLSRVIYNEIMIIALSVISSVYST